MEEIEGPVRFLAVLLVEGLDTTPAMLKQGLVLRHVLLWCIGKIGEQGEVQVWVGVAQVVEFQLPHQEFDVAFAGHQAGNNHHGAIAGWDTFLKVQPGQHPGRHGVGNEPIDQVDGYGRSR